MIINSHSLKKMKILLREKWNEYNNITDDMFENAWNEWCKVHHFLNTNSYFAHILKKFLMNKQVNEGDIFTNGNTLILNNIISKNRKIVYELASRLGLYQKTVREKNHMHITKSPDWKWEFTNGYYPNGGVSSFPWLSAWQ